MSLSNKNFCVAAAYSSPANCYSSVVCCSTPYGCSFAVCCSTPYGCSSVVRCSGRCFFHFEPILIQVAILFLPVVSRLRNLVLIDRLFVVPEEKSLRSNVIIIIFLFTSLI